MWTKDTYLRTAKNLQNHKVCFQDRGCIRKKVIVIQHGLTHFTVYPQNYACFETKWMLFGDLQHYKPNYQWCCHSKGNDQWYSKIPNGYLFQTDLSIPPLELSPFSKRKDIQLLIMLNLTKAVTDNIITVLISISPKIPTTT